MKPTIINLLILLCMTTLLLLLVQACPDSSLFQPRQPNYLGDEMLEYRVPLYNNNDFTQLQINLKSGQAFRLAIPSNPTTGYSWDIHRNSVIRSGGLTGLSLYGCEYKSNSYESSGLVGGGGIEYWEFSIQPETPTSQQISIPLVYNRPWLDQPNQPSLLVNIQVSDKNTDPDTLINDNENNNNNNHINDDDSSSNPPHVDVAERIRVGLGRPMRFLRDNDDFGLD